MADYSLIALDETVENVSGQLKVPTATDTAVVPGSLRVDGSFNAGSGAFTDLSVSGSFQINNPADTFQYILAGSAITADRTVTLPLLTGNDTFAFLGHPQTWTAEQGFDSGATAPTRDAGDDSTHVATTEFVRAAVTAKYWGLVSITEWASLRGGDGGWTAAFNQALSEMGTSGKRTLYFPYDRSDADGGDYRFTSKPNNIGFGLTLLGDSPRQFLVRDYTPPGSTALDHLDNPFIHYDGSLVGADPNTRMGGGIVNLGLGAGDGTSGGTALKITGQDSSNRPGFMRFENTVISYDRNATGLWYFGLMIKGENIDDAGSQGVRDIMFDGLYIFRCVSDAAHITNGVHVWFVGLSVNDGGAGNPSPVFRINGGGTAETNSQAVYLSMADIFGTLSIDDASKVVVDGYVSEFNATADGTGRFTGIIGTLTAAGGMTITA